MTSKAASRGLVAMVCLGASVGLAVAPAGALAGAGFGALSGRGGCFVTKGTTTDEVGGGIECHVAKGLLQANAVAVSPDGANVYVTGGTPGGTPVQSFGNLAILKRDPSTGALTPLSCLSSDGSDGTDGESGACTPTPSLLGADGVAVSPDGLTVYVASRSSASIVAFARDPASGSLTRLGCLQGAPRPGSPCRLANVFIGSGAIVASADNTALYVAAPQEGALTSLTAPRTSVPAANGSPPGPQPASTMFATPPAPGYLANPCIAINGFDGSCAVGTAMGGLAALDPSADGKQLYGTATTSKAVDVFSLAPEGGLAESGCLMVDAPTGPCKSSRLIRSPTSVTSSPDGRNVYLGDSANGGGRIDVLARNAATGQLSDASCVDFLPKPVKAEPGESTEEEAESPEEKRDRERELQKEKEEREKEPPDECHRVPGLEGVSVLAVSGDGSSVYAFGDTSAVTFTRDPATGALTEASCAALEDSRCASLPALRSVQAAAISPDGHEVYVVGAGRGAVMAFSIGAAVTTARASVANGRTVGLRVACPPALRRPCSGRVELAGLAGRRRNAHRPARARRVALGGSSRFSIAPGRQALVRVRLSSAAQRLLRDRRRLRVAAIVRAETSAGGTGFGRHLTLTLSRR